MSVVLLSALAVAGCATAPLPTRGVAEELTPDRVRANPEAAMGETVLWGGRIVGAINLPRRTRLEVVAYPLDEDSQRPRLAAETTGRFHVYFEGYVETAVYAPGRLITVRGTIQGMEQGRIGKASYAFPVVDASAHKLWPKRRTPGTDTGVHFGFGIILTD